MRERRSRDMQPVKVAIGFKSHSGWTASVCIGAGKSGFEIIDRRRIELIKEGELWAKQPYHAAEDLAADEARAVVKAGIKSAHVVAFDAMKKAVKNFRGRGYELVGCGVLMPQPMPEWTIEEILSVHFRMHKAEGVLFPGALCRAAEKCGLTCITVPEKNLAEFAERIVAKSFNQLLTKMGKDAGPPWAKDQRNAALAAMIVLKQISE
jgi:hypothetical protein